MSHFNSRSYTTTSKSDDDESGDNAMFGNLSIFDWLFFESQKWLIDATTETTSSSSPNISEYPLFHHHAFTLASIFSHLCISWLGYEA
jgi:hypothetical protein